VDESEDSDSGVDDLSEVKVGSGFSDVSEAPAVDKAEEDCSGVEANSFCEVDVSEKDTPAVDDTVEDGIAVVSEEDCPGVKETAVDGSVNESEVDGPG
jgi:hypothetical protein